MKDSDAGLSVSGPDERGTGGGREQKGRGEREERTGRGVGGGMGGGVLLYVRGSVNVTFERQKKKSTTDT